MVSSLGGNLRILFTAMQSADVEPTEQQAASTKELHQTALQVAQKWASIKQDVATVNAELKKKGLQEIR